MKEILFAVNGVVIGNRQTSNCVNMSYGEMFDIIHKFLNTCRTNGLETIYGMTYFIRLKEGNGSPYPIEVSCQGKYKQLKPDEILAVRITPLANEDESTQG